MAVSDLTAEPQSAPEVPESSSAQRPMARKIEEGADEYCAGGFHPVYIGDVYNDRYRVVNKIGYGVYSTVWLVKDLLSEATDGTQYRAMKVLSALCYSSEVHVFEREILTHLRDGDPKQLGYDYICHLLDDFEHQGPNGTHVCLVFELMGETLGTFRSWFKDSMIPNSVMRKFTIQLLLALDYAHDHKVIHTDIKPSNIFVKFRKPSLIESNYLVDLPLPEQDRTAETYSPIPSAPLQGFYFDEATKAFDFDITLGDWGVSSWTDKHLCKTIQPVLLRSPEVLIEAPWDAKTDFWNLGATILEVFRAVRMFSGQVAPDGHYELKEHLAEIVHHFGPFPKDLLDKGAQDIVQSIFHDDGTISNPFSDSDMYINLCSEDFVPDLDEDVREEFVSFLKALMKINPSDRLSPNDLLRHPWLGALK